MADEGTQKSRARNTAGLRPWKPGQSGNPKGRPKKEHTLTNVLEAKLDAQMLADALLQLVRAGDLGAIKYAYDRIEGSPTTRHETSDAELRRRAEELAREFGKTVEDVQAELEHERMRLRFQKPA